MSLSVDVFVTDESGEITLLDVPAPGADLAGFESFRVLVWGSDTLRGLGARYFPVLSDGDLEIPPEQVAEFLRECALVRVNLDRVAPRTDTAHPHQWYVETISKRLANIEAAAERALDVGGGVMIW